MKLTTERLILRDLNIKDAKEFINECTKETKIKPRKNYNLGIELKSEKKVIGCVALSSVDKYQGTASLGCWIGEEYWRQGIGTEALKKLISFAFDKLKLRRVEAGVYVENKPSYSMIEKMGFKFEGTKIKSRRAKATGKIHDEKRYALLREEYEI